VNSGKTHYQLMNDPEPSPALQGRCRDYPEREYFPMFCRDGSA